MALFKIYKGNESARLTDPSNSNYQAKVDGHCYFDISTGLFYIDAKTGGTDQNPVITRAPLNALKAVQDADGNIISNTYIKNPSGAEDGKILKINNGQLSWMDGYSLPIATSSKLGGVKSSTTGTTANRDYNVQINSNGTMKVNVPWENTTYTLPGLMGGNQIGNSTTPVYWNGSSFQTITSYGGKAATAGTADKVSGSLKIGDQTFTGAETIEITIYNGLYSKS